MKLQKLVAASAISLGAMALVGPASAAYFDVPVPTNAYIVFGGLEWAWAYPLPADSGIDLSYQATQGWRLPTAAEILNAPAATDFLVLGGNVPFADNGYTGGTDPVSGATFQAINAAYVSAASAGACATPYFSGGYKHCDWQDGNGQPFGPWAGAPGAPSFADQLVVRAVPEPETYAMMLAGLGLLGAAARRRRA
ncbi:MAG TPA: FxDxF family PEP-CTERM protein [Rhodocyclaceae bacterium]|nr:FxDxF family PEP-CTERM protein [Rhodocyclaceae bacterium]